MLKAGGNDKVLERFCIDGRVLYSLLLKNNLNTNAEGRRK
jgi:hypothetical protein